MNKIILSIIMAVTAFMGTAQKKIGLTVGNNYMTATLVENEATRALLGLLAHGPVTIKMDDYGGFEKVGALPQNLPVSDTRITTHPGDIMLYQGNSMVIFYGSNTWNYTRLGQIDGATAENLRQFLGCGPVSLTISSDQSLGVSDVVADSDSRDTVYDLKGNPVAVRPLPPGYYIINGEKRLVR